MTHILETLTWAMQVDSYPEPVMWLGTRKVYRNGPWNGVQYTGKPTLVRPDTIYDSKYFNDGNEVYYMIFLLNKSKIVRMTMNQTTNSQQQLVWLEAKQSWNRVVSLPRDFCDGYGACGPNGNCDMKKVPSWECLRGFKSKSPERWNALDYSDGCVRNKLLNCKNDGFVKYIGMKVPDTTNSWFNQMVGRIYMSE
ncbi:S-receptor-like serine/threonine-protein kinase [Quillaja saponaria]|uniref:S-receptor-like serine/threonine-protein kinase n=1 Tax=Quillaja saponaria TaxID=32244 RepID=A0AAD7LKV6_QUISA|nr:S-receptor-like serine/threonine-protein kinase [Quillaja saponaria]